MEKESNKRVYASMMVDSLQKKCVILVTLYDLTVNQEKLLKDSEMDADEFAIITEKKGSFIEELNSLDSGFDSLYKKLEIELTGNQSKYAAEISQMKELISRITDLSTRVQILEKKNYEKFQLYMKEERTRLKNANASQQTASTYARNMVGSHREGNSYFVNETK